MTTVPKRPRRAKPPVPVPSTRAEPMPPSMAARPAGSTPETSPASPPTVAALVAALDAPIQDLIAAGRDATAPPGERDLGRRAARRIILEAERAIGETLAFARGQGGAT